MTITPLPELDSSAVRTAESALDARIARFGEGLFSADERRAALSRFVALAPAGDRPGRFWKHDLSKIDVAALAVEDEPAAPLVTISDVARSAGVTVSSLEEARRTSDAAFVSAFGQALDTRRDKLGSLAIAFQRGGAFITIPAGVALDEPIEIVLEPAGSTLFPYVIVAAGEGARATFVERIRTAESAAFVCGAVEIVAHRDAQIAYCSIQEAALGARVFMTRASRCAADASVSWYLAELGSTLAVSALRSTLAEPGAKSDVAAIFFANGAQHVDLRTDVDHVVGQTTSQTLVKSVASERGQARYYGNITIRPHAHGSEAALKDDALLLSTTAHVDSVPALEIAANDVRAFHGATVGAIDEDQIFYAMSRGITRVEAERMIALGFFGPAVGRFPLEGIRNDVQRLLEAKILG